MRRSLAAVGAVAPVALLILLLVVARAGPTVGVVAAATAGILLGVAVMAALGWGYLRYRIDPLARVVERLADGEDVTVPGRQLGDPRLERAYTRVSDALRAARTAAVVDRLTGVPNRASILATLAAEVERAVRYDRPLAVAFIDADRFKAINDTFGHQAGDRALEALAHALRGTLRTTDVVGRYGGEEFLVILPETSVDDAATISEKLRAAVEKVDLVSPDGRPIRLTISVGITGGRGRMLHADDLLRGADAAMFAAKSLGRNQVSVDAALDELAAVPAAPISVGDAARAREIGSRARRAAEDELLAFVAGLPEGGGRPTPAALMIADALARRCGMGLADVEKVRLAAMLRDVGKVAVPGEILAKEGPLTGAEWQLVAQHPRIGQVILEQSAALRDVAPLVLHHHERWNGRGYPYGLRAEEIPLGARIVAIADAYDAMVASRPHRRTSSHAEAREEIRQGAGTQFDPDLVSSFLALFTDDVPPPPPDWLSVATAVAAVEAPGAG